MVSSGKVYEIIMVEEKENWRGKYVMFVCRVIVGRIFRLLERIFRVYYVLCLFDGYDLVFFGLVINLDEFIVFNFKVVFLCFLVVYMI